MANAVTPAVQDQHQKPRDRDGTASYVAEMAGNLAFMARGQGLDTLGYILEMAKLEAENAMRPAKPRR